MKIIKQKVKENAKKILDDFTTNNLTKDDFDRGTFYNHIVNLFHEKATDYDFVNDREITVPKKSNNLEVVESFSCFLETEIKCYLQRSK